MKPTVNVSLNGMVYHVEDDAYRLLQTYLEAVENRLSDTEDVREIMLDIEARIAELFADMLQRDHVQVVTVDMVASVEAQLGTPDAYVDTEDTDTVQSPSDAPKEKTKKRFYRDPNNQLLGGVCSGLAAYLGWDPFWVRVMVIALTCFYGIAIPIYFVIWMIAPAATTAAQRLEMQGEVASVENIKKMVEETKSSPQVRNGFRNFLSWTIKLLLGLTLLCILLPLVGILIAVVVSLFGAGVGVLAAIPFLGDWHWFHFNGWWIVLFVFNALLVVAIPIYVLVRWLVKSHKHQHLTARFWWISAILWFICILGVAFMSVAFLRHTDITEWNTFRNRFTDAELITETRDVPAFEVVSISGAVDLKLRQDPNQLLSVSSSDLDFVSTTVTNDTLFIEAAVGPKETEIYLSAPSIRGLFLRGAANIETEGTLQSDVFSLDLAGASDADLSLDVDTLYVTLAGASDLSLSGVAQIANLRIMGGSEVSAYSLVTNTMDIYCAGAGEAEVHCTDNLYAQAYGASVIRYKGKPAVHEQISVGASSIRAK